MRRDQPANALKSKNTLYPPPLKQPLQIIFIPQIRSNASQPTLILHAKRRRCAYVGGDETDVWEGCEDEAGETLAYVAACAGDEDGADVSGESEWEGGGGGGHGACVAVCGVRCAVQRGWCGSGRWHGLARSYNLVAPGSAFHSVRQMVNTPGPSAGADLHTQHIHHVIAVASAQPTRREPRITTIYFTVYIKPLETSLVPG
jgi:hypothetical protein